MFVKEVFLKNGGADVIVSDGEHECRVFSYPCQVQEGEEISQSLIVFETGNIIKSATSKVSIQSQKSLSEYNYWIVARVVDVNDGEVSVGNLRMVLGAGRLPGDIRVNEVVEFAAERIDL